MSATPTSRALLVANRVATALFCLQMGFTAYAQLRLPQLVEVFDHLGFPPYFRVELALAKIAGIVAIVAPLPARVKEWAYAGFTLTLVSAIVAHVAKGEGIAVWGWAAGTLVLGAVAYTTWRLLPPKPRAATAEAPSAMLATPREA